MEKEFLNELKIKVLGGYKVTKGDAVSLCSCADKEALYNAADEIRDHFCGSTFELCSIVNAKSGKCSEDCKWCSQSVFHETGIEEYASVDQSDAVKQSNSNFKKGVSWFSLVASGRAVTDEELDSFILLYKKVKESTEISLCASFGLLNKMQLVRLKDAGIRRYHCNLETSPSYFAELCTTHTSAQKIQTIRWAQEAGLTVCSGGIIGMGETIDHRIELALALRDLGITSIPINILNPIKGTRLENMPPLTEDDILTTIALFRFINPSAFLRFAGGRALVKPYQDRALHAGINASIVGDMLTTTGSASIDEDKSSFIKAGYKI